MKQLYLSALAFHRVLKLAQTIADLDNSETVRTHHVAKAIQYRPRTMTWVESPGPLSSFGFQRLYRPWYHIQLRDPLLSRHSNNLLSISP